MKQLKTAAILAALLVVLGGLATWDEWKTKHDTEEDKTKNHLVDLKPEDVIELDYTSKGQTADEGAKTDEAAKIDGLVEVSAVKKDGVWRLTKPVDVLADAQSIESLIKAITDYSYAKVITDKRDQWAEYGLVEPARHVTVRTGGDSPKSFTMNLGNKTPVGFNVYLRTSVDDKVLLGSQHIMMGTSKTLNDFRDKTLLKIDETKLKNVTYQRKGEPQIELTKSDGRYTIVKPEPLDADSAALKDFIDELNLIKVASFIDSPDPATKAVFQEPDIRITWQHETGEEATLKVTEREGKLLASFDPNQRVYVLPDDFKGKLRKELNEFRNRRVLDSEALDVKTIEIDGDIYQNVEGNWYFAAEAAKFDDKGKFTGDPKDKPQEKAFIRAFMVDLEFAKTDRFIPLNDPVVKGLTEAPEHRITLNYHDTNKPTLVIELFKGPSEQGADDRYLVKRSGGKYVYRVAKTTFNSMTPGKEGQPKVDLPDGEEGPADDEDDAPGLDSDKSSALGSPEDPEKAG